MGFPEDNDLKSLGLILQRVSEIEGHARASVDDLLSLPDSEWRGHFAPQLELGLMASGLLNDYLPAQPGKGWEAVVEPLRAPEPVLTKLGDTEAIKKVAKSLANYRKRDLATGFRVEGIDENSDLAGASTFESHAWYVSMLADLADVFLSSHRYAASRHCIEAAARLVRDSTPPHYFMWPELSSKLGQCPDLLKLLFAPAKTGSDQDAAPPRVGDFVQTTSVRSMGLAQRVLRDVLKALTERLGQETPDEPSDVTSLRSAIDVAHGQLSKSQRVFVAGVGASLAGLDKIDFSVGDPTAKYGDAIQAALMVSAEADLQSIAAEVSVHLAQIGDLPEIAKELAVKIMKNVGVTYGHENRRKLDVTEPAKRLHEYAVELCFAYDDERVAAQFAPDGSVFEGQKDGLAVYRYDYALPLFVRLIAEIANREIPEHENEPVEFSEPPTMEVDGWLSNALALACYLVESPLESDGLVYGPLARLATEEKKRQQAMIYTAHVQDALSFLLFVLLRHQGVRAALQREAPHDKAPVVEQGKHTPTQEKKTAEFIATFEQLVRAFIPVQLLARSDESERTGSEITRKEQERPLADALGEVRLLLEFSAYCRHFWKSLDGEEPLGRPELYLSLQEPEAFKEVLHATAYLLIRSSEMITVMGDVKKPAVMPHYLSWFVDGLAGQPRKLFPEEDGRPSPKNEWQEGLALWLDSKHKFDTKEFQCARVARSKPDDQKNGSWFPSIPFYVSRWISAACTPGSIPVLEKPLTTADIAQYLK